MVARNRWVFPTVVALLGFIIPLGMLSIVYITAPDSPLFAGPSLPAEFMPAGAMPDFPNGPVSLFFVLSVGLCTVAAAFLSAWGVVLLGWWFRRAKLTSLLAVVIGPIVLWLVVFVVPMSHRAIRDYNAGFTRTDLLSYTAILWAWVIAAMVAHFAVTLWGRGRWAASPT